MLFDSRHTLPGCRRLRRQEEFERAFRAGKSGNAWFAVHVRKNEQGFARIGLAVSKRVMPKAVSRNLAKRMIREVFRQQFPSGAAMDIVVYPRRPINRKNLRESRNALNQLLEAAQ